MISRSFWIALTLVVFALGVVVYGIGKAMNWGRPGASIGAEPRPNAGQGTGVAPVVLLAQGSGSIVGEVILTGAPPTMQPLKRGADPVCAKAPAMDEQVLVHDGKLRNVVVHVVGRAPTSSRNAVVVDQESCAFRPRVQGAVVGQRVEIRNSDGTLHNVHGYAGSSTLFNFAQPPRAAPIEKTFTGPSIIKFKCDVHPWMTAFVVVSPSAYFSVTGPDGAFSISGLADGKYVLEAWHERFGTKTSEVTMRNGVAPKLVFTYSSEDRG